MKPIILAAACATLTSCVEPPPATALITSRVLVDAEGCPTVADTVDIDRNDKISWSLDSASEGFPAVEGFEVIFGNDNPTYCVNDSSAAKHETITCTIRVDARLDPICYTLATRSNGGMSSCGKRFLLRVGNRQEHRCTDP